ncbi:NnrS family protein [Paracoccus marinaquae]|uniref:NnrS family protein n=1 Tax=Paracoccus marinaquae TaxID=2841926 RepID=A0ABS6ALS8_9RHOB|nr:NnrS family protein [Paracoccus marinaquae]MBU3030609.1 NnrS family protein [Paracoccus marinaquae]
MTSTAEQMRAWRGPALLSFGFRPMFLGAAIWAALAMVLWLLAMAGRIDLPTRFDPASWHAHEFLFGYLSAVIAGFLLTAVPNWTGHLPVIGWPLGGLLCLWIAGRLAILFSTAMPPAAAALADLAMPVALLAFLAREVIRGRNWRNLPPLTLLGVFTLGNAVFHWEAAQGHAAAQGFGLRIGLGAAVMLIALVGGRILPSFTRNWLVRQGPGRLPVPPMQGFDRIGLMALLAALVVWIAAPEARLSALMLAAAGALHLLRLSRWAGERTGPEPLLWILHLGYAFLPAGALVIAAAILWPGLLGPAPAQHLWMAGAIGSMTLAVMTRSTLTHTGQRPEAGRGTLVLYLSLLLAVAARLAAGLWPSQSTALLTLSGLAWIGAFGGFALLYGPALLRPRQRARI